MHITHQPASLSKVYSAFSVADWNKVIISDECRLERHCSHRKFVTSLINQKFIFVYITKVYL